jgi:hypothetical protein
MRAFSIDGEFEAVGNSGYFSLPGTGWFAAL